MCPHWGHGALPAAGADDGAAGGDETTGATTGAAMTGAAMTGAGANEAGAALCTGATLARGTAATPPTGAAAPAGTLTARTPCAGVDGENGFGAASRGSSAPQPRQNL
jgi:hypothetical protein